VSDDVHFRGGLTLQEFLAYLGGVDDDVRDFPADALEVE
jgi:hypothetical protein